MWCSPLRIGRTEPIQAVERALEDVSSGELVDEEISTRTRTTGLDQRACDGGRRQALVPEGERELDQRCEVARKRARRLRGGPFRPVHVARQAQDEAAHPVTRDERYQLLRILREFPAHDRLQRRGDDALHIRQARADRLRTDVEAHQPRMARQRRQNFDLDQLAGHRRALARRKLVGNRTQARRPMKRTAFPVGPKRLISTSRSRSSAEMKITWFGHSNFRLEFGGKVVLIDPFFTGNPSFKGDRDTAIKGATHILITHGHADHIGDTVPIAKKTGSMVITNYELANWLTASGVTKCAP